MHHSEYSVQEMKNSAVTPKKNEFMSNLGKRQEKKSPPKISFLREAVVVVHITLYYMHTVMRILCSTGHLIIIILIDRLKTRVSPSARK